MGILLDVHHRNVELPFGGRIAAAVEVEVVGTPFAAHKFQSGETQVGGLLEAGKEHSREAYGGEVAYGAYNLLVVVQRYLELVPLHCLVFAVAGWYYRHLFVGDVVAAYNQIFGPNRHLVLEIALVFVEGIVLIYIFHVGGGARRLVQRVAGIFGR